MIVVGVCPQSPQKFAVDTFACVDICIGLLQIEHLLHIFSRFQAVHVWNIAISDVLSVVRSVTYSFFCLGFQRFPLSLRFSNGKLPRSRRAASSRFVVFLMQEVVEQQYSPGLQKVHSLHSTLKEKCPLPLLCSQTAMRLKSGPRLFRISSPSFSRTERRFLRVSMSSVLEQCTKPEICVLLTIQSKCPGSLHSHLPMVEKKSPRTEMNNLKPLTTASDRDQDLVGLDALIQAHCQHSFSCHCRVVQDA